MGTNPTGQHHPVAVYAKQVVSGRLHDLCCPYEIKACQRHLDDLKRQGTPEFPYVFDTTRADRITRFMELLVQVRGPFSGQRIQLQPWQVFDLGCLYGWVEMESGARRFTTSLNVRGRGNVKSTENSGKGLYAMNADACYPPYQPELARYELNPEVECAAVDKAQARRVAEDARKIARATPDIRKRMNIPKAGPMSSKKWGGEFRTLSSDTKNKDGGAPCYFCVDEYEAHPDSEIYELGQNSGGKRLQFLLDCIMTAGDDADNRPAKAEEDYAKQILDGDAINENYFVMIREVPEGIDPHDQSKWCWANPVLRYPNEYSEILLKKIKSEYVTAYGSADAKKIRKFLTRRLCRWVTAAQNSYLDEVQLGMVRDCMVTRAEFAQLTDGLDCWPGFDLGKRIDLSGVAAVFLLPDGRVAVKMHGFMPQMGVTRHEHTDKVPYRDWISRHFVTETEGEVTDNRWVKDWIYANRDTHGWIIREVCYDGHNAVDLAIQMCEDNAREDYCVEIRQTCAGQNLAVKTFRELLLQGKLVIEYSPLAMWCLKNAIEITNNYGDSKLSKKHKDDSQRIDPVAAAMNALARALVFRETRDLAAAVDENYEM
ncbi:MAG: hypothetical protein IJ960_00860 [Oscillospiraceae bacterium]|nr:hypothetical protein [Oscillospiraceae bacterium]